MRARRRAWRCHERTVAGEVGVCVARSEAALGSGSQQQRGVSKSFVRAGRKTRAVRTCAKEALSPEQLKGCYMSASST